MKKDSIYIEGTIIKLTIASILFSDGVEEVWLPKSQIELIDGEYESGVEVTIEIPIWLAKQKNLY